MDIQDTNLDMAILTAFQLSRNWNGRLTLCLSLAEPGHRADAQAYLEKIVNQARLPKDKEAVLAQIDAALAGEVALKPEFLRAL